MLNKRIIVAVAAVVLLYFGITTFAQPSEDTTNPIITLIGDSTMTIKEGSNFVDPGATAEDNKDGDITSEIVVTGEINEETPGIYKLYYNVKDKAGNDADEVVRTVEVVNPDPKAPVITLKGDNPMRVEVGHAYVEPGATALDDVDGTITLTDGNITGVVNTSRLGRYLVRYNVSDENGNHAIEVTRVVIVEDTTLPIISLTGDSTIEVEVNTPYTDQGATVTDNYYQDLSVIVGGDTVDTSKLGTYTITYNAVDGSNNHAVELKRTVIVKDDTVPEIKIDENVLNVTLELGDTYTEPIVTVEDNSKEEIIAIKDGSVDTHTAGKYLIYYTAKDSSENEADPTVVTVIVKPLIIAPANYNHELGIEFVYPVAEVKLSDTEFDEATVEDDTVVDINTLGEYTLTYNYILEPEGIVATSKTTKITVQDTTPPTGEITYSTTSIINGSVIATLETSEKVKNIDGWTTLDNITFIKEYSNNINSNITFEDLVGNIGSANLSINNIDKTAPTFNNLTFGYHTTGNITIDVADPNLDSIQVYNQDLKSYYNVENGAILTAEATYQITAKDLAGNKTIIWVAIDRTNPTITGFEDGGYYNHDVTITVFDKFLTNVTNNGIVQQPITIVGPNNENKQVTFTVSTAGTYTIVGTDKVGNSITKTFTIDKKAPDANQRIFRTTSTKTTGIYATIGTTVYVKLSFDEVIGTLPAVTIAGVSINTYSVSHDTIGNTYYAYYLTITEEIANTLTQNADIPFTVLGYKDLAGNEGLAYTTTSNKDHIVFDSVKPEIKIKDDSKGNDPYFNTVSFEMFDANLKEANLNGTIIDLSSNSTGEINGISVNQNYGIEGKNTLTVKDKVGNEITYNFYLDVIAPTFTVDGVSKVWVKDPITLTINANDNISGLDDLEYSFDGGITWTSDNTEEYTGYKMVKIIVRDKAGNKTLPYTAHVLIDVIKPNPPTVELNGYNQNWTKDSVKINLSLVDYGSGLNRFQYSTNNGITWNDTNGELIFNSGMNVSVIFRAIDNVGNEGKPTVPYSIKIDRTAPVVTLEGTAEMHIRANMDEFIEPGPGSTAIDNATDTSKLIFSKLIEYVDPTTGAFIKQSYTDHVDNTRVGRYKIWYYYTDEFGNRGFAIRNVYVERLPMAITYDEPNFQLNMTKEYTIGTVANSDIGTMVRAYFTLPEGVEVKYYEATKGTWLPLTNVFGPSTGFPLGDINTALKVKFTDYVNEPINVQFRTIDEDKLLGEANIIPNVYYEPMQIETNIPTFTINNPEILTIRTIPNSDIGKLVRAYFNLPLGVTLEYQQGGVGPWLPLNNVFGPSTGFPLGDITTTFRATLTQELTNPVNVQFKMLDGTVLGSFNIPVGLPE